METQPRKERGRGRRGYARGGKPRNFTSHGLPSKTSEVSPAQDIAEADTNTTKAEPISFEAKIALALSGSSWQDLQQRNSQATTLTRDDAAPDTEAAEGQDEEVDDADTPPTMTAKQKKKKERFDSRVTQHAGDVLDTIAVESVDPVVDQVSWDEDPELLCCYNWQSSNDGTNTIFVPGEPAKWQPPPLPHAVKPDSGFMYADYNYARQPKSPYEAMFRALSVMNPNYQFMDVDILADRNNLRVLLEFVQGKSNGPFRLDLYSIYNTLVIMRNESRWWKRANGESYGCNFERSFTKPAQGMEDSTSHYRAIRYSLGPLSVVCRFEADAYDDGVPADELTVAETEAVVGGLAVRPTFKYNAPIRVLQKGHIVPTSQMVELKTKAIKRDADGRNVSGPVQCQDQLWFGRTSLLYTAPYESGTGLIDRMKCENAVERVKNWENKNQESLRKLAGLLIQLKAIMKRESRPNRSVILVREDKSGPLSVRSMESYNHAVGKAAFDQHWRQYQRGPPHNHRGTKHAPYGRGGAYSMRGGLHNSRGNGSSHIAGASYYASNGRGGESHREALRHGRGGMPQ